MSQLVSFLILVDQSTPHGLESSILHSNQPMNIAPQPVVGGNGHWLNTPRDHSVIHATRKQPLSQRHFTPSSAGHAAVPQCIPVYQRFSFTLCALARHRI